MKNKGEIYLSAFKRSFFILSFTFKSTQLIFCPVSALIGIPDKTVCLEQLSFLTHTEVWSRQYTVPTHSKLQEYKTKELSKSRSDQLNLGFCNETVR